MPTITVKENGVDKEINQNQLMGWAFSEIGKQQERKKQVFPAMRDQIFDIARAHGCKVVDVNKCTHGKDLLHRLFKCRREQWTPDIRIEHGEKSVAVNLELYVLLWAISRAANNHAFVNSGSIVCVPEDFDQDIPSSVMEYADVNNVVIYKIDELPSVLSNIFNKEKTV